MAATIGHIDIAKTIPDKGAKNKSTLLNSAVAYGDLSIVKMLLEKEANIEATDERGWRLLHLVAVKGYVQIVKVLIRKRADTGAAIKG